MTTHARSSFMFGWVMIVVLSIPSGFVLAEDVMEEIIVTAPGPGEADHSFDYWWFDQAKIRQDGGLADDIDRYDYYLDYQHDYEDCLALALPKVEQCKTLYTYYGAGVCILDVIYVTGYFGRFIPKELRNALVPFGQSIGSLGCVNLTLTALEWCETDFPSRLVSNCMDEDGS